MTEHYDKTKMSKIVVLAEVAEVVGKIQVTSCSFKTPGVDSKHSERLRL